jgi:chromosome segregation ATPase
VSSNPVSVAMSTRAAGQPARKGAKSAGAPAATSAAEGAGVVQQVLAERRELLIANERLRLELEELRGRSGRADPRVHVLELENRALRDELAALRAELARFEDAIAHIVDQIEKASP